MNVPGPVLPDASSHLARRVAAALCLAVAVVHVINQGGLTVREPRYVGIGYLVLEVEAVVAATMLVFSATRTWWLLSLGVAAGPLAGYVLSRSVGLPGYTDDVGNWFDPLGLASLAVEATLLVLAALAVVSLVRPDRPDLTPMDAPAAPAEDDASLSGTSMLGP